MLNQKHPKKVATPGGFEPPTHCLEGSCSIQLSYGVKQRTNQIMVPMKGFEPPTYALRMRCSTG